MNTALISEEHPYPAEVDRGGVKVNGWVTVRRHGSRVSSVWARLPVSRMRPVERDIYEEHLRADLGVSL